MGHEVSGNDDGFRGTEVKRFAGSAGSSGRSALQKVAHNLDKPSAQICDVRELSDVHASQPFRQAGLVARRHCPVREVIGKTLADEMMFLQRSEAMLKNGSLGTVSQRVEELR